MCTLEQAELREEDMGFYTHGQMIRDPIHGQISYNCFLSNDIMFKPGHNLKILLVKMERATVKEIAEHVIAPWKDILACSFKARCVRLLIITHRLWKDLKKVEEIQRGGWWTRER